MRNHKTQKVKCKCDDHFHDVNIDVNIAPLIKEIWEANINTHNSCENDIRFNNYALIEFSSGSSFEKFVSIVCDVDSKIKNDEPDIYRYFWEKSLNPDEKGNKPFMVIHRIHDENFIFKDLEEYHKSSFKEAKRPIIKVKIYTSLFIRSDLIKLITQKMNLYNTRKNTNKERIGYFCDGTGKIYNFGSE